VKSSRTPEQRTELNRLVERLINVIYLLKLQTDSSPEIHRYFEFAEKDLQRLLMLIQKPRANGEDKAA